jgi:hypothetical protein
VRLPVGLDDKMTIHLTPDNYGFRCDQLWHHAAGMYHIDRRLSLSRSPRPDPVGNPLSRRGGGTLRNRADRDEGLPAHPHA